MRIVPRLDGYLVEVVYEQQEEQAEVDKGLVAALDPGVNVLAALDPHQTRCCPPSGQRQAPGKASISCTRNSAHSTKAA